MGVVTYTKIQLEFIHSNVFQKYHHFTNHYLKRLRDHQDIFGKCETRQFSHTYYCLYIIYTIIIIIVIFFLYILTVKSCTQTLSEAFSSLDFYVVFVSSWTSCCWTFLIVCLGRLFQGQN